MNRSPPLGLPVTFFVPNSRLPGSSIWCVYVMKKGPSPAHAAETKAKNTALITAKWILVKAAARPRRRRRRGVKMVARSDLQIIDL